ncbi:MAG: amino acid ABC transporter substrate-binding protein [Gammaproteobacteria bacterium]|nr:MAG: amino acid ABC transporter substrate-binding protein [Gammaproteobacteria bacterium]RKZ96171.1 MAG: amino acid ABC transporter substrate-binding protein [Gammaproteobacteria bacterium]
MIKKLFLLFTLLLSLSINCYADTVDSILERGTLKVGVSLFEPWTMQDESGQLSGFEIDVATKIAQDMGVKPEFIIYKWENIITALRKGEIDIIAGGMAITPERALKISFSQPYAHSGLSLATNTKLTKDINDFEQLNQPDVIFTVVSGTVSHDLVKRLFAKAKINAVPTPDEASQAVVDGKAHAYVSDSPQPEFLALRNPDKVDMPLSKPLVSYRAGFGVNKGEQEWLNFLNTWITARTADKWLSTAHKHWFKTLDWNQEAE